MAINNSTVQTPKSQTIEDANKNLRALAESLSNQLAIDPHAIGHNAADVLNQQSQENTPGLIK